MQLPRRKAQAPSQGHKFIHFLFQEPQVARGGRRPVRPVYVHQFQTYARERVWPGRRGATTTATDEVVDVQVREVPATAQRRLPPEA